MCTTSSCSSAASCERRLSQQQQEEDSPCCWICLAGAESERLEQPCKCPRSVHLSCLSRWQLQQAGREEEQKCRFCCTSLPDWRKAHSELPKAIPIMTVVHQGVTHQVAVNPGPEGEREFIDTVRRIYGLAPSDQLHLSFGCKVPGSNAEVTLEGAACYDAAVHLASISAGERIRRQRQQQEQQQQLEFQRHQQQPLGTLYQAEGSGSNNSSPRSVVEAVRRLLRS